MLAWTGWAWLDVLQRLGGLDEMANGRAESLSTWSSQDDMRGSQMQCW